MALVAVALVALVGCGPQEAAPPAAPPAGSASDPAGVAPAQVECTQVEPTGERAISAAGSIRLPHAAH